MNLFPFSNGKLCSFLAIIQYKKDKLIVTKRKQRDRTKQTFQLSNPHRTSLLTHKDELTYNRAEIKIENHTA